MYRGNIGSDPEVFATDGTVTNGAPTVIPAFDALGGDVELTLPYGIAYCDGAAIEFNVTPSPNGFELASRLFANLAEIRQHVSERGLSLSSESYGYVGRSQIERFPEHYGKRASLQILGCSEDFSAYREELPARPDPRVFEYRTLGGHIHLELPEDEEYRTLRFSRILSAALDSTIGIVCTSLCNSTLDLQRKQLYGLSGTYRRPPHGYEYRTPPARALLTDQGLTAEIFSWASTARDYVIDELGDNPESGQYTSLISVMGGVDTVLSISDSIDRGQRVLESPLATELDMRVKRMVEKYSPLFAR